MLQNSFEDKCIIPLCSVFFVHCIHLFDILLYDVNTATKVMTELFVKSHNVMSREENVLFVYTASVFYDLMSDMGEISSPLSCCSFHFSFFTIKPLNYSKWANTAWAEKWLHFGEV